MVDWRRLETSAHLLADDLSSLTDQPRATYLALYQAAVDRGAFAAAAPLFAQLLACDHLGPAQAGLGRRARWRGPLNRSR
jgi:hypothetical protein